MNYLFLCYPKCTTCQKAKKWLESRQVDFTERNIKEDHPSFEELRGWIRLSGLPVKKFLNTSGMLYRERKLKDSFPGMSEEEQIRLLSTDGMLVKRPVLVSEKGVLVGFSEAQWEESVQ